MTLLSLKEPEPARLADPAVMLAEAFAAFKVPPRLSVAETAEKYRILENTGGGRVGPFRFSDAPWLRRPHDCLNKDSGYNLVAFMGPAQSGKTSVGDNWMMHTVIVDPASMLFVGPDKALVRDYVVIVINKMIGLCEAMQRRLKNTAGANNITTKEFQGCDFFFIHPVKDQFRQRAAARFRVEDYDALPEDIEGEGDALMLLSGRQTTFEGYESGYCNSSPALGQKKGIEAVVAGGTDERWHTPCPHCQEFFVLGWDCLRFKKDGTPEEAAEDVVAVCPHNGCIIEERHKRSMNARGVWLGPEQSIDKLGNVSGERRKTSTASFRAEGPQCFARWGTLTRLYRLAQIRFETTQDEHLLKAFMNARIGVNYISQLADQKPIDLEALRRRRDTYRLGQVPIGVAVLTAAVDVQGDRFEVIVLGWGPRAEAYVVDRFAIMTPPGPQRRKLDPARYPEHWACLLQDVFWRQYPLEEGGEKKMPILNVAIDTGGIDGVSEHAKRFWYLARKSGVPEVSITLLKGGNQINATLLPKPTYLETTAAGRPIKSGPRLWVPNVHRLKNILDVRLRRDQPGPGYLHFPADLPTEFIDELLGEEKNEKGLWERVQPRNETLDLYNYAHVAYLRWAGDRNHLRWIPAWARRPAGGDIQPPPPPPEDLAPPPDHPHARSRRRPTHRGSVAA